MYVPPKFSIHDDLAWQVVKDAGAGMLVIGTPDGLASVFVPVVVSEDRRTLTSHVARANPWWRSAAEGIEVLGLFLVASAYVTPSYYPSRAESPGVVPTWNYVAAEVRGRLTLRDDPQWKAHQVRSVTGTFEAGRDPEWRVEDSPTQYIEQQLKAIVGIEIEVLSIEGKAKLSQNRPVIDHDSVREHLAKGSLAEQIVARRMTDNG
jgi:transcriptional regulator